MQHAYFKTCASVHFTSSPSPGDEGRVLVYAAPLRRRVRFTKLLSLTSSCAALAMAPVAVGEVARVSLPLAAAVSLVTAAFLSTPLLLHWITRRYVLELHFTPETKRFDASTFDLLTREVCTSFVAEEVRVPDIPGFLSNVVVRGRPLFVDARMVRNPDAYAHMMGYDQPLDLRADPPKESQTNAK
ncbi:hypothetical protein JTE90_021219 [Oedothorax gibbosus]|uniref:Transmembrane protein 70 n=1 Tax=Oedothorax gibbosus TaxID=931172 RepID=A0AAV6UV54_9ARAC|nr:hypothetical protein JTE90_021219 [Oedothorax gibbosus]